MTKEQRWMRNVAILFSIVVIAAFIVSIFTPNYSYNKQTSSVVYLDESWEKTSSDSAIYRIPDEMEIDLTLELVTGFHKMDVYLDDELLVHYTGSKDTDCINTVWVSLPCDSSGKTLSVTGFESERDLDQFIKNRSVLGNGFYVYELFINRSLIYIIYTILSVLMGFALLILSYVLRNRVQEMTCKAFLDLSLFLILTGMWVISDSEVPSVMNWNVNIINFMNFISFANMPLSVTLFIQRMSWNKYHMSDVMVHLTHVLVLFYLLAHILFGMPIFQYLIIFQVLVVAAIMFGIHYTIREMRDTRQKRTRYILNGIIALVICSVVSITLYLVNPVSNYNLFMVLGMIIFIGCLMIPVYQSTISGIYDTLKTDVYRQMAYRDILTGLSNRTAMMQAIDQWSTRTNKGIVVLDLNNLKKVNDAYGHSAGDELIQETANYIKQSFGKIGACYRIGGDEFVVLLENKSMEQVEQAVMELQSMADQYNETNVCKMHVAWGYTLETTASQSFDDLFDAADQIMYQRKKSQKSSPFAQE